MDAPKSIDVELSHEEIELAILVRAAVGKALGWMDKKGSMTRLHISGEAQDPRTGSYFEFTGQVEGKDFCGNMSGTLSLFSRIPSGSVVDQGHANVLLNLPLPKGEFKMTVDYDGIQRVDVLMDSHSQ